MIYKFQPQKKVHSHQTAVTSLTRSGIATKGVNITRFKMSSKLMNYMTCIFLPHTKFMLQTAVLSLA